MLLFSIVKRRELAQLPGDFMKIRILFVMLALICVGFTLPTRRVLSRPASSGGGHAIAPSLLTQSVISDNAGSTSVLLVGATNVTGETIIVGVTGFGTGVTVSSITNSAGESLTLLASMVDSGDGRWRSEIWGKLAPTTATNVTIVFAGGSANWTASVQRWTNVNAFGNSATAESASSAIVSTTNTMQDANNISVMVSMQRTASTATFTAGTLIQNSFQNNQASTTITSGYNTQAGSGSLIVKYTLGGAVEWTAAAIELRSNP